MVPTQLTQRFGAERHDTSGEPDVKPGGEEMENKPEANNMMMMFERMLQEQHAIVPFGSGSLRESGGNRRGFGLGGRKIQIKASYD